MRRFFLLVCCSAMACGGRIADEAPLDGAPDFGTCSSGSAGCIDSGRPTDGSIPIDVISDVPSGACTLGPNIGLPTANCSGDEVDWFATPYTPPAEIAVDRIEAHMARGNVALLASADGAPGAVLFVGLLDSSAMPTWRGTDASPPVVLTAGALYYIAFQGDCSFAERGSEAVEYMAPSVKGPWHVQGNDNWTARPIGTCR